MYIFPAFLSLYIREAKTLFDNPMNQPLIVNNCDCIHYINLKDIVYVQSFGNSCELKVSESKIVCTKSLALLNTELPASVFLRISQSYIINRCFIEKVDKKKRIVIMRNGDELPYTIKVREFIKNNIE